MATPLINAPAPAPATATPLVVAANPLRKQTLLGIAPTGAARSEPPVPVAPAVAAPSAEPAVTSDEGPAALAPAAKSQLRSQTLLGLAPAVLAAPPAAEPSPAEVSEAAASVSSVVTPAVIATDAPTTSDVEAPAPVKKTEPRPPAPAVAALSSSHDDLPELKPKRSRLPWGLGVAAAIALGVVGLRQLDHAPTPVPAELARPVNAAKPVAKAPPAAPKSDDDDDDDDDDDGNVPNTGTDTHPEPIPPEPEPVNAPAKADDAPPSPSAAAAPGASAAVSPVKADHPGEVVHINITSDPPGARLFWKGKEQGTTPFVLEFPAGERHSYEMGLPGYTVRKVVIDGSKTDINIGMKPEPAASSGAKTRK